MQQRMNMIREAYEKGSSGDYNDQGASNDDDESYYNGQQQTTERQLNSARN